MHAQAWKPGISNASAGKLEAAPCMAGCASGDPTHGDMATGRCIPETLVDRCVGRARPQRRSQLESNACSSNLDEHASEVSIRPYRHWQTPTHGRYASARTRARKTGQRRYLLAGECATKACGNYSAHVSDIFLSSPAARLGGERSGGCTGNLHPTAAVAYSAYCTLPSARTKLLVQLAVTPAIRSAPRCTGRGLQPPRRHLLLCRGVTQRQGAPQRWQARCSRSQRAVGAWLPVAAATAVCCSHTCFVPAMPCFSSSAAPLKLSESCGRLPSAKC